MSEVYEIRLSPKLTEILIDLVKMAEKEKAVSAQYRWLGGDDKTHFHFHMGREKIVFDDLEEDVIFTLQVLGFIYAIDGENGQGQGRGVLVLAQQAFEWVKYERKGWVGKAFYRGWHTAKAITTLLVANLAVLIGILLALLEILRLLNFF